MKTTMTLKTSLAFALMAVMALVATAHEVEGPDVAFHTGNPLCEHLGDGRSEGGLAVVNVADGADVDMGLATSGCRRQWMKQLARVNSVNV